MVDQELLDILVCPETKSPVKLVGADVLEKVNGAITGGAIKNRGGEAVTDTIDGGLLREDGQFLYPIRDDIPIRLIGDAIPMGQVG